MILLDTCVLFWIECDQARLSPAALSAFRQPSTPLYASAISAFELGLKVRDHDIDLPRSAGDWVREICSRRGIRLLPLDAAAAGRSTELPPIHRDPCDRFLVATALNFGLQIATPDILIPKYPGVQTLW
jgi:PIN domain nuclease of toxin-antitoxin system